MPAQIALRLSPSPSRSQIISAISIHYGEREIILAAAGLEAANVNSRPSFVPLATHNDGGVEP